MKLQRTSLAHRHLPLDLEVVRLRLLHHVALETARTAGLTLSLLSSGDPVVNYGRTLYEGYATLVGSQLPRHFIDERIYEGPEDSAAYYAGHRCTPRSYGGEAPDAPPLLQVLAAVYIDKLRGGWLPHYVVLQWDGAGLVWEALAIQSTFVTPPGNYLAAVDNDAAMQERGAAHWRATIPDVIEALAR